VAKEFDVPDTIGPELRALCQARRMKLQRIESKLP
jgi:hypothetical protein